MIKVLVIGERNFVLGDQVLAVGNQRFGDLIKVSVTGNKVFVIGNHSFVFADQSFGDCDQSYADWLSKF